LSSSNAPKSSFLRKTSVSWPLHAAPPAGDDGPSKQEDDVDFFYADGFSSLLDDSRKSASKRPKSPFEGGQTILLGSEDERSPVEELPRRATTPPPPPINRRAMPASPPPSTGSSSSSSDGGGARGKRPKRFAPPWQQEAGGGSGRRSASRGGPAQDNSGFIPSTPPPAAGSGGGQQQQQQAGNGTPPPTRVYRPPGSFDLEPARGNRGGGGGTGGGGGGSARQREDQQVFRLLGLFGNPNGMLFGAVALALGTVAFGWAWKSGALENSSLGQAMMQDPEATAYMTRNEVFPRDVDVTVTLDDKVVSLSQEGGEVDNL